MRMASIDWVKTEFSNRHKFSRMCIWTR